MVRLYVATLLLSVSLPSMAQLERNHVAAQWQDTVPPDVFARLKSKLESDKATVTEGKSNVKAFTKELYQKRFEFVVESFNNDYFMVFSLFTNGGLACRIIEIGAI